MSLSEDLYESYDMTDLHSKLYVDPSIISDITVTIYLYNFKVYDNLLEDSMFPMLDLQDGIPIAMPDQIDFLISLCQIIVDNGGQYRIVLTWQKIVD
jgi:hypothetical protein